MVVMIAAYLNRETRDGRMIKSITIGEPPWPISAGPSSLVGYVASAVIADDALLVDAEFITIPEPDWEHFCLAPTLRTWRLARRLQIEGELAAFFVMPRDEWAW